MEPAAEQDLDGDRQRRPRPHAVTRVQPASSFDTPQWPPKPHAPSVESAVFGDLGNVGVTAARKRRSGIERRIDGDQQWVDWELGTDKRVKKCRCRLLIHLGPATERNPALAAMKRGFLDVIDERLMSLVMVLHAHDCTPSGSDSIAMAVWSYLVMDSQCVHCQ